MRCWIETLTFCRRRVAYPSTIWPTCVSAWEQAWRKRSSIVETTIPTNPRFVLASVSQTHATRTVTRPSLLAPTFQKPGRTFGRKHGQRANSRRYASKLTTKTFRHITESSVPIPSRNASFWICPCFTFLSYVLAMIMPGYPCRVAGSIKLEVCRKLDGVPCVDLLYCNSRVWHEVSYWFAPRSAAFLWWRFQALFLKNPCPAQLVNRPLRPSESYWTWRLCASLWYWDAGVLVKKNIKKNAPIIHWVSYLHCFYFDSFSDRVSHVWNVFGFHSRQCCNTFWSLSLVIFARTRVGT